jgi:hypothetical protein
VDASDAKIFSCVRQRRVDFSAHWKTRYCDVVAARRARAMQKTEVDKTLDSSAFMRRVENVEAMRARRKISAAPAALRLSRASRQVGGRRSYAQTQVRSLLFFSCCSNPVSVPVDSRRHCTMSPSTQARRAAMAKKRKKAAKPAKKRRKKK